MDQSIGFILRLYVKHALQNIEAKKAKYLTPVKTKKGRQFYNKYRNLVSHMFLMKASLSRRIYNCKFPFSCLVMCHILVAL